jgi:hypothetical protein
LPVPDLWLTISRYLASLKAVLAPCEQLAEMEKQIGCKLTRAQVEANWRQFERTDQVVKQFMLNEGPELQRDLKEYANRCQNWVSFSSVGLRWMQIYAVTSRQRGHDCVSVCALFWLVAR